LILVVCGLRTHFCFDNGKVDGASDISERSHPDLFRAATDPLIEIETGSHYRSNENKI
jgi:hypothetical protein